MGRRSAADGHITYDIHQATQSPIALEALKRIGELYAIEEQVRGQLPATRQQSRTERATPKLDALHAWMIQTKASVSKKSDLAGAIQYALSRWRALTRYCEDGRIEIDNNIAERSLRPIALGRNYPRFAIMQGWPRSRAELNARVGCRRPMISGGRRQSALRSDATIDANEAMHNYRL